MTKQYKTETEKQTEKKKKETEINHTKGPGRPVKPIGPGGPLIASYMECRQKHA